MEEVCEIRAQEGPTDAAVRDSTVVQGSSVAPEMRPSPGGAEAANGCAIRNTKVRFAARIQQCVPLELARAGLPVPANSMQGCS